MDYYWIDEDPAEAEQERIYGLCDEDLLDEWSSARPDDKNVGMLGDEARARGLIDEDGEPIS